MWGIQRVILAGFNCIYFWVTVEDDLVKTFCNNSFKKHHKSSFFTIYFFKMRIRCICNCFFDDYALSINLNGESAVFLPTVEAWKDMMKLGSVIIHWVESTVQYVGTFYIFKHQYYRDALCTSAILDYNCYSVNSSMIIKIPLKSSAICIFLLNLLYSFISLTCSSCFILNFNIFIHIILIVLVFMKFYTNSAGFLLLLMERNKSLIILKYGVHTYFSIWFDI